MSGVNRIFWVIVLCLGMLALTNAPAFAGDRPVDKRDLQGISAKKHRWAWSALGGAALGAGVGLLVGGADEMAKFGLIGGGAMSDYYLHKHRNAGEPIRGWAYTFSNAALGTGLGWTICGCRDGALGGLLIGAGGTAAYEAAHEGRGYSTAQTSQPTQP
jgi:hypothetical protein